MPYRPPRATPKPRIAGVQTATVVGPKGQIFNMVVAWKMMRFGQLQLLIAGVCPNSAVLPEPIPFDVDTATTMYREDAAYHRAVSLVRAFRHAVKEGA